MGAALKLSGVNGSAWIVDGGSNGGVMKLAGESRKKLAGSLDVPLIGIAVAQGQQGGASQGTRKASDIYETKGHTHLILAVDRDGNCPVKKEDKKPCFGYEIEYTKFFEDSLSKIFAVPIVGLLGSQPASSYNAVRPLGLTCFAVGGGKGSLQNVVEAIAGDFPVVVIKGTGRVADLICAIREHESMTFVKNQCKGVRLHVLSPSFFFLHCWLHFPDSVLKVINVDFKRLKKCSA
jgi:hypothetical protein